MRPVTRAPYSADQTTEQLQTLADGTHITRGRRTVHLYRDSQGRTRTERPLAMRQQTENWTPITEVRDPMVGFTYILDDQNKIAHRFALAVVPRKASPCLSPTPGDASRPQCSSEKLATQNMEGLLVEGTRETRIWPIGSQGNDRSITDTIETWISTELHEMVLSRFANPRDGETLIRLTNLSRAEPDQSLFQPPADYIIVDEKDLFTITLKRQ